MCFSSARGFGAELRFLLLEHRRHRVLHVALDALGVQFLGPLHQALQVQAQSDLAFQRRLEAGQVPLLVDRIRRHVAGHQLGDHVAADAVDVVLDRVGIQQFVALGEAGIRAFGKADTVLYDVKYVLPREAVDGRL